MIRQIKLIRNKFRYVVFNWIAVIMYEKKVSSVSIERHMLEIFAGW